MDKRILKIKLSEVKMLITVNEHLARILISV